MDSLHQPITFFTEITRFDIVKTLIPALVAFVIGILITPLITKYMFKYELWKKKSVSRTVDGKVATLTKKLHNDEARKVPRMGGLVIVLAVLLTVPLFWLLSVVFDSTWFNELNFLSRGQTLLPLAALVGGFAIGVFDDLAVVGKIKATEGFLGKYVGGGVPLRIRISFVALVGLFCGWWFFSKLGYDSIYIPFWGELGIGWAIIPLFVVVMAATYSGGIIDGVDGLSGGVMAIIFTTYSMISFLQFRFDLATLCLVIVGGILAFLWFNIPPARFFMSETGMMALTLTLSVVAFFTDTVLLLPIIALPLVVSSLSVIIQVLSKKLRNGKKVFLISPLHNHFQALGWPAHKVTMRYWVMSQMVATIGFIIFLLGYQL